jgi:TonB family protein
MAAAARSRLDSDEVDTPGNRKAFLAGAACAAALLAIGLIALRVSSSKPSIAPAAAVTAVQPQFSKAVTDQVAEVEADFEQDNFRKAQADLGTLRELAPEHPRLRFFTALLERNKRSAVPPRAKSEPVTRKSELPIVAKTDSRAGTVALPRRVAPVRTAPADAATPGSASSESAERPVLVDGAPTSSVPLLVPAAALPDTSEVPSGSRGAPSATPIAASVPASGAANVPTPGPDARRAISDAPPRAPARAFSTPQTVTAEAQLTHRVAAQYPESALRNGIQGYVDVQFTITPEGTVTNATVVRSDPGEVFNKAALDAVRRWRYDPRVIDGRAVGSQSQVRVQFKLDSSLSH